MSDILTAEELYKQTHGTVLKEYYLVYIYSYIVLSLLVSLYFVLITTPFTYIMYTYVLIFIIFVIGFPRII
jgi:hypothetical protein